PRLHWRLREEWSQCFPARLLQSLYRLLFQLLFYRWARAFPSSSRSFWECCLSLSCSRKQDCWPYFHSSICTVEFFSFSHKFPSRRYRGRIPEMDRMEKDRGDNASSVQDR